MNRELDKKIGKLIYGFDYLSEDEYGDVTVVYKGKMFALPYYSTNIADTEKAIGTIQQVGLNICIEYVKGGRRKAKVNDSYNTYEYEHRSASMAICLALCEALEPKCEQWNGDKSKVMDKFVA